MKILLKMIFPLLFSGITLAGTVELKGSYAFQFSQIIQKAFEIQCQGPCKIELKELTCQFFEKGYDLKQCAAKFPTSSGEYVIAFNQDGDSLLIRNILLDLGFYQEQFEQGGILQSVIELSSLSCHLIDETQSTCVLVGKLAEEVN
jgi:hypothetical protein